MSQNDPTIGATQDKTKPLRTTKAGGLVFGTDGRIVHRYETVTPIEVLEQLACISRGRELSRFTQ